jgi:hypothetical protein
MLPLALPLGRGLLFFWRTTIMKALVLKAKHANTMILECGAVWLKPGMSIVVEESLGSLVAAKYALEIEGETELTDKKKWKVLKGTVEQDYIKPKATGDSDSIEESQSTRDMGSSSGKKKTKKKAAKKV